MSKDVLVKSVAECGAAWKLEAEAQDAFRELWDRVVDQGGGMVTPTMVKEAIEARLRDFLGPGVVLPRVSVGLRYDRTGFDVSIVPGELPPGMRVT